MNIDKFFYDDNKPFELTTPSPVALFANLFSSKCLTRLASQILLRKYALALVRRPGRFLLHVELRGSSSNITIIAMLNLATVTGSSLEVVLEPFAHDFGDGVEAVGQLTMPVLEIKYGDSACYLLIVFVE